MQRKWGTTTRDELSEDDAQQQQVQAMGETISGAEHAKAESKGTSQFHEIKEQPMANDTPPDWGGDSQTDEEMQLSSWPWGEQGRPSDLGQSRGVLGQRPNEPTGEPRRQGDGPGGEDGGVRLIPNRIWRDVRTVQNHMARAREKQQRKENL